MKYDNYGNITKKNGKDYSYGNATWKDLLTGFDGKTIEYDAQGNPTTYLGHTLTWEKGRQLKKFDNIEYTYNANGIRTSKIVDGIEHKYILEGAKILCECWDYDSVAKTYRQVFIPLYDNEDSVCGILYNNVPYYFIKNLQGDVIAIVDKDAQTVARYSYDAWGKCLSILDSNGKKITNTSHVACINPFRYRGYYYDEEMELYYLQSRYYDASVGRFINADTTKAIDSTENHISTNIFQYCENAVVANKDTAGKWLWNVICGVAGAALFGGIAYFICDLFNLSRDLKTGVTAGFATVGAVLGAIFGPKLLVNAFNKIKPWLKEMRRKTKRIKYNPKNPENLGGVVLFGVIKVMVHLPHLKNPRNPHKFLHLQIEFGSFKIRIPLGKRVK